MWSFDEVNSVQLEITNICNWYCKKCPLSFKPERKHLPAQLVLSVMDDLSTMNFKGDMSFYQYCEPLMDPRLYFFLNECTKKLPNCSKTIVTNGSLLTKELRKDIESLKVNIVLSEDKSSMDSRLELYDFPKSKDRAVCPRKHQVVVSCSGDVVLCCYEWRRSVKYGNLEEKTFREIMNSGAFVKDREDLCTGIRNNEVCQRCWSWMNNKM